MERGRGKGRRWRRGRKRGSRFDWYGRDERACSESHASWTNGDLRVHRGLDRFVVRGLPKVRCVVLWAAITDNVLRLIALGGLNPLSA